MIEVLYDGQAVRFPGDRWVVDSQGHLHIHNGSTRVAEFHRWDGVRKVGA